MDDAMLAALREAVGAEQVADSRTARVTHAFDATQRRFLPDVLVYPNIIVTSCPEGEVPATASSDGAIVR